MTMKKELLSILICPACHGKVEYNEEKETLDCVSCHRRYPIKGEIPVMLVEEAIIPEEATRI